MSIVFAGPGPCLRGWGRLTGHWCHWSLVTSPLQCLAPGPRLLSPRAPAPGHHDTHHVTCDNVMSVTWLRWELGMSWHWRAACGHSEQEPGGTRSRLRGALACRARGHQGRHTERVSATLWAPLLLLIMKQCHGWQFDQGNDILNIYPRRVANWYSERCWWSDNTTIIKIRMMALNPPWPRMTHLGLLTLNQVLLILSINAHT